MFLTVNFSRSSNLGSLTVLTLGRASSRSLTQKTRCSLFIKASKLSLQLTSLVCFITLNRLILKLLSLLFSFFIRRFNYKRQTLFLFLKVSSVILFLSACFYIFFADLLILIVICLQIKLICLAFILASSKILVELSSVSPIFSLQLQLAKKGKKPIAKDLALLCAYCAIERNSTQLSCCLSTYMRRYCLII